MPLPGQTNLVTCDGRGRIVCFQIQEGKGDLCARILALGSYARGQSLGVMPLQVFDREGDGLGFFSALVAQQTPFATWEKNADHQRLLAFEEQCFPHDVRLNGTDYRLLEETKACVYSPESDGEEAEATPAHRFDLRRVVLWNLRTGHRTSVLCWDGGLALTPQAIAAAILNCHGNGCVTPDYPTLLVGFSARKGYLQDLGGNKSFSRRGPLPRFYLGKSAGSGLSKGWNTRYITDFTDAVGFNLRGEEYSAQIEYTETVT